MDKRWNCENISVVRHRNDFRYREEVSVLRLVISSQSQRDTTLKWLAQSEQNSLVVERFVPTCTIEKSSMANCLTEEAWAFRV